MLPIVTIEIELNQFNGDCGACKRREENRRVCNKRAKVRERERNVARCGGGWEVSVRCGVGRNREKETLFVYRK